MLSFFRNLFNVLFPPKKDSLDDIPSAEWWKEPLLDALDAEADEEMGSSKWDLDDRPYDDPSYFEGIDPNDPRDFDDVNPDDSHDDESFYPPILTEEEMCNYRTPDRHRQDYYPGEW